MTNVINEIDISKLKTVDQLTGRIRSFFTDKEIIELAKGYDCPHYLLTNPITQKETFLFIHAEVEQWLVSRYLKNNRCVAPQVIHVNNFNYDECRVQPFNIIPKELIEMQDLYYLPAYMKNTPPGIYFLCQGADIVYVGQSLNAGRRVQDHKTDKDKQFDNVYFIPCHVANLDAIEGALIRIIQPLYNARISKGNSDVDDKTILQTLKLSA